MSEKESQTLSNEDYLNIAKRLEARMFQARETQHELILSLRSQFPSLTPSLSRSLTVSSHFNNNHPFDPIPITPNPISDNPIGKRKRTLLPNPQLNPNPVPILARQCSETDNSGFSIVDPLLVVRSMVAVCLLKRVPFAPIDSNTLFRKLEYDDKASEAEKSALRVAGEDHSGEILAVEMALRSMAEDNEGVAELEEVVINGKSSIIVMGIDRTRLVNELPKSKQNEFLETLDSNGIVGQVWLGLGPGPMRGGPLMFRPAPVVGQSVRSVKPRTEEEDLEELEALLNKKSFKELQKSKTEEDLLDFIWRPTAKETVVAAKVESLIEKLKRGIFMFIDLFG